MSATTADQARARARSNSGSLERQRKWALWGSYAALSAFVIMFLTPPFYMIMTSLDDEGRTQHAGCCNYLDEFVRVEGRWLFAKHTVIV